MSYNMNFNPHLKLLEDEYVELLHKAQKARKKFIDALEQEFAPGLEVETPYGLGVIESFDRTTMFISVIQGITPPNGQVFQYRYQDLRRMQIS